MNILSLFVVVPVLTIVGILFTKDFKGARVVSAIGMSIQLVLAAALILMYLGARKAGVTDEMLWTADYTWFKSLNIHYAIGVDGIAVAMIGLTAIVVFAGIFASWEVEYLSREFFISLILLATGVFGFFISLDLFTMFLFYELAVIPMYLLIGVWGSGPKEASAMKLTLMLMGGSALLMVGLFGLYYNSAPDGGSLTWNILEIAKIKIPVEAQRFFFPFTFIGFGILGALFPFHTWSPDGHASAPTAVSMLHAGVLMKLGGYGCFRVAMFLMPEAANEMAWIFIILTTISVVYGAFGAIWQKDLKFINAYSSVSHCGLVIFALLMMNQTAMDGAILQMISHGLMTALFFALIGMIYGRTHTRNITEMGGLMKVIPFLAVVYMIAGFASLGLPGLSGFVAEMTVFVGSFQHQDTFHRVVTIIAASSIVITAVYILRVVGMILLGPVKDPHHLELTDAKWFERLSTITLVLSVAAIGIAPLWLSDMIQASLEPIVAKLTVFNPF
ncbi:MAG: NADH dehydrogenase [Bacteroidetes bacterium GWF2_42_66]|nr:MAG: NADH dehydrogenase [Bacteroidetes bacterium GWA2_42_15]OFY00056.1 MAG: NADH dehydrogenase [Bacteroidetes bacterium GWE2_42_39]OFY40199.1 MAG: NADH dehydrogenase [Bacteroidetes bacterium GWF2_42_66]HBL74030.1 NADH-quinone oxidoreductase subunit M [Prolixibacteraceae bacterium]HCR89552.1 NADH-quinone oxidoreductase subunit M [Prolixibacteraceae bacterium]